MSTSSQLHAIVLATEQEDLYSSDELEDLTGITLLNIRVPGGRPTLIRELVPFLHQPFTKKLAGEIKDAISSFFYQHHDPFVLVIFPKNAFQKGVLQIVLHRAVVGNVSCEGNLWSKEKKLKRQLRSERGDEIDLRSLDRSLYLMNRNPFRRVDLIYTPGEASGTTDLTLYVNERRPWRIYAGFDNTGVATTGRQRWLTGATFGNMWDLDQIFSAQFISSYTLDQFHAFTGQYIVPLPFGHQLNLYGGYSRFKIKQSFPMRRNKGYSSQASARYLLPFDFRLGRVYELFFGFDYKGTNSTVEFSQIYENFSQGVNLAQFIVGYNFEVQKKNYQVNVTAEIDFSPGKWLPKQTNQDYNALRPHAKNQWVVGRASCKYTHTLPKEFTFLLNARGQFSSQNLLPSEQIGLGGFDTVRGYTERQLNYDSGFLGTIELHSPHFPIISAIRKKKIVDEIYFLLFADYGVGGNHNLLPGEPNSDYLLGVGPGIRYQMSPYILARCDWGIKLHRNSLFIGGGSMVYFSATISY